MADIINAHEDFILDAQSEGERIALLDADDFEIFDIDNDAE